MPAARPCPIDQRLIDKAWLQEILRAQPGLLSLAEIEAAFGAAVCIRREAPTKVGWIDNLYIRPAGYLTLVETKLWRNLEAGREAVGQILGYEATEAELTSFDRGDAYAEESQGDSADVESWVLPETRSTRDLDDPGGRGLLGRPDPDGVRPVGRRGWLGESWQG